MTLFRVMSYIDRLLIFNVMLLFTPLKIVFLLFFYDIHINPLLHLTLPEV